MFFLKLFHPRKGRDDFRGVNLTQSGEQRLFFVGRMFWRRMSEVVQRRFETPVYFLGRRVVDDPSHRLEHAEEHLHAPMAVRQQTRGISKVMGLCSNLNWHILSLPIKFGGAVTKVLTQESWLSTITVG